MALSARKMFIKSLISNSFNVVKQCSLNGNRLLYTRTSLGITGYESNRAHHKKQFTNLEESFRKRMTGFVEKPDNVIFSEDLKAMLYIIEKNPEDLDLVMKMIKRYHEQKKQLRFSNFTFGPVVMRAFYYLDEPDLAFQAFKDPELNEFFDQLTSIQILMDLLWNHGKYQDCLEAYELFTQKPMSAIIFPRNASVLAAAACYKLNTSESLEKGLNILKDADVKSVNIPRRTILFIAALALKQNRPEVAMELVSKTQRPQYITSRCIKLEAYAQLKRYDEILMILKHSTAMESPSGQKQTYFFDSIKRVEDMVNQENFPEDSEIVQLLKYMSDAGHVQNLTLEEHLTTELGGINTESALMRNQKINKQKYNRFNEMLNNNRFGLSSQ